MITLKDVARDAGLSPGTVSDILNGRQGVRYGSATVDRVRRSAERLGYRKNRAASALRSGRSRTVGVVVPDLASPVFGVVLQRMAARLRGEGYGIVVEECPPGIGAGRRWDAVLGLVANRVDGLFAPSAEFGDQAETFRSLAADGVAVLVPPCDPPASVDSVAVETGTALRDLLRVAARFGHRRLVLARPWRGQGSFGNALDRLPEDWQGIVGGEGRIETVFCEGSGPGAREAFRGAWESGRGSPDRPTCALAASEPIALGVARACRDLRLGIPGGLGLASLERSPLGGLWPAALTGLGVDPVAFADRCANLLLSRMSGRDEEGPKALRFEAELFLGETLAVAPGRG